MIVVAWFFFMNCNLLIWNVRGLNTKARRDVVFEQIRSVNADIVCLQETKRESFSTSILMQTLGPEYLTFAFLPASDTRGGILVAWRASHCSVLDHHIGDFSVSVKVCLHGNTSSWWLTNVYGPQSDDDKVSFLNELRSFRSIHGGPWTVVGDFNMIYLASDKNNQNINKRNLGRFKHFINEHELKDISLRGRLFTWSNERERPTLEKLDRVLVSIDWEVLFPNCYLQALSSSISDHAPLLLTTNCFFWANRRFLFESFWTKLEGYLDVVKEAWTCPINFSDPIRRLDFLLLKTSKALKSWGTAISR